jgi:hypothetical protein
VIREPYEGMQNVASVSQKGKHNDMLFIANKAMIFKTFRWRKFSGLKLRNPKSKGRTEDMELQRITG